MEDLSSGERYIGEHSSFTGDHWQDHNSKKTILQEWLTRTQTYEVPNQ